ncbi:MAG: hypothetical protein V4633_23210 [Pseudomonadota bacterium]
MDTRISTLESDVAAIRASVEAVQSNYASNLQLAEVQADLRLEIVRNSQQLDHKIDTVAAALNNKADALAMATNNKVDMVAADLKLEFTKANAELRVEVRNWVLATVVALFGAFGGMSYMMYNIATRAT